MAEAGILSYEMTGKMEKQLRLISSVIKETGRQMLKEYNLSPPQFIALQWISEKNGITIGELSSFMYFPFSTTTDLVDRIEEREFVKRVRDENDKRLVRIYLLPKGEESIKAVIRKRQEYLNTKFADFTEEEIAQFQDGLNKLYTEIRKDF
ncbi:DNA-binding MarR family transcriptional regulator [Pullulanibacillus pueri]|uniref:Putative HTH-type transcriptional regulator YsmB n=1 Tax=Pullulanibacillus pueri TaxID=1437324 RepID=A0A8J2ZWH7_9BACL|nr:MarR family transcriptional regulator [Pullulanibacillus pueri]MBM7681993.1 DNA-binding MarR family transcriptional regulator [Pullulanibacillus pueri]GGH83688.1 putative HTH-type transcriptional regulator YsmB [Pullulanibacillus pueri]